jgi:hypothetical protein
MSEFDKLFIYYSALVFEAFIAWHLVYVILKWKNFMQPLIKALNFVFGNPYVYYFYAALSAINIYFALEVMSVNRDLGTKWGIINTLCFVWFIYRARQIKAQRELKKGR